jgi:hypothetical protein
MYVTFDGVADAPQIFNQPTAGAQAFLMDYT